MKVLIADDDEDARTVLIKTLEYAGYSVDVATDGLEALKMAKASPCDLIISDILMPEMDGFILCQEVMKDPQLKKIPFIFYTASYADPKDEQLARYMGASYYILKPLEPMNLLKIVDQALQEKNKRRFSSNQKPEKDEMTISTLYNERISQKLQQKVADLRLCRNIFTKANHAIAVIDPEGFYLEQNTSHQLLFEYSDEEILEKTPSIYLGEDTFCDIFKILASHGVYRGEHVAQTKSDVKVDIDLSIFPVFDHRGKTLCYVWMNRDTTVQKCAEKNVRLKSEQMEELTKELRALSIQLSEKEEISRREFSRVLHEQVGQDLSAIRIKCCNLLSESQSDGNPTEETIYRIIALLDDAISSTRTLTSDLYPTILDDLGILPAISWYKDLVLNSDTLEVSLDLEVSAEELPENAKLSLFRIVQEAFQNIAKHAFATKARITLKKEERLFKLLIQDNGIGFETTGLGKNPALGIGLTLVKERCLALSGQLNVKSSPGKGTQLTVTIPVKQESSYLTEKETDSFFYF